MASVTTSIGRAALALCRHPTPRRIQVRSNNAFKPTTRQFVAPFSHASRLRQAEVLEVPDYSPETMDPEDRAQYDAMTPDEREAFDREMATLSKTLREEGFGQTVKEIDKEAAQFSTWSSGNTEQIDDYFNDDVHRLQSEPYMEDGMTSMAHDELEQHRELRDYARIIAWEMPLLSHHTKPFELPSGKQLLRFRYTTYMGETHPAESKVVVEFCSKDLVPTYLNSEQRETLLKLVGPRYNPGKDLIHMSAEHLPTRAQNKRYLGDLVKSLIKEAKEGDSFKDVPLDLRHYKPKPGVNFPRKWALNKEQQKQLRESRLEKMVLRELKQYDYTDGNEVIEKAIQKSPALNPALAQLAAGAEEPEKEPVPIRRSAPAQWRPFSGRR